MEELIRSVEDVASATLVAPRARQTGAGQRVEL